MEQPVPGAVGWLPRSCALQVTSCGSCPWRGASPELYHLIKLLQQLRGKELQQETEKQGFGCSPLEGGNVREL